MDNKIYKGDMFTVEYYMVRANRYQDFEGSWLRFKSCFENGIVAVGWSDINFGEYEDNDELEKKVREVYYPAHDKPKTEGKYFATIRRFRGIKQGDIIVVPYYDAVRFAIASGNFKYNDTDYDLDFANQLEVKYVLKDEDFLTVPRVELSEALQRRLRMIGGIVLDLSTFGDEIDKIIKSGHGYSYSEASIQQEEKARVAFEKKFSEEILINIQSGKTYLQSGGLGLQRLLKELFECEGYTAKILSTRATRKGDVDIEAVKSDKFFETKIMVQIKHHEDVSGVDGINQLLDAKKYHPEKYSEAQMIFITSADDISDDAKDLVSKSEEEIIVVKGNELANWVYENVKNLSPEMLSALRISTAPRILAE